MLDVKFIVENPDVVKKDLKGRGENEKIGWIDELIEKQDQVKKLKEDNDKLRHSRNLLTREINELKKQGKDVEGKIREAKKLPGKISDSDAKIEEMEARMKYMLQRIPNVLHESVPDGRDDTENREVKRWGEPKKSRSQESHGELLERKGLADFTRAARISGAGFFFIKGDLVKLELALVSFALGELEKRGFTPIATPLMMRRGPYEGVVTLGDFEDVMYKIDGEDSYLIATSEHPIGAMHMGETMEEKDLPLKYAGFSACFRKEIGSHGVDTRGLFRVHQFNKVEMFVFSKPDESWDIHEELLKIVESIVQKLEIPYRVVNVCKGDIGMIAAKKYDVEAWFPRQEKYGEIVSCSNCTNYQAVPLNVRYKPESAEKSGDREYVHTLNSTAIALGRMMVAIVENCQNEDGSINVPEVLREHVGKKVIGLRTPA